MPLRKGLGLVLLSLVTSACTADNAATSTEDVVGGRAERGYPSVGYLVKGDDDAPFCTATVIAPDRVVTAAHCVDQMAAAPTSFGLAVFGGPRVAVARALRHASWSPEVAARGQAWLHDVAVLTLASRVAVPPSAIGQERFGCSARYVGYGRVTEGGRDVEDGYTGERKSTAVCIDRREAGMLHVRGDGGGVCWGDSGGPLFVEGRVAGVLHGHTSMTDPRCEEGNQVVFTALDDEREFLACALDDRAPLAPDMHCHWADALVRPLVAEAIVAPFSDGTLRPDRAATRADWARWVALALDPPPRREAPALIDAPAGELGAQVERAIRGGYFDGVEEVISRGRFRGGASMTRREALVGLGGTVERAAAEGLAVSYPDPNDLRLEATLTRAEAASMITLARRRDHR